MFNKNDLKNGMFVEFNDGKRRLVWENRLIDEHGFIPMNYINEDLYNSDSLVREHIIKVYLTHNVSYFKSFFSNRSLTCIWDRTND